MKQFLFLTPLVSLFFPTQLNAVVIVAEETQFTAPSAQPLFPAGNLNVFKQFVLGFEVHEEIGEKVEVDLIVTTLEFGGEVEVGIGAHFGLEFGLCLGGNADYDLTFAPRITLPDVYPTEVPVPITVAEGLIGGSHFETNFPSLGTMYADLILDLSAQLRAEACVFGCFTPIDIDLSSCDLPLFNLSDRCDPTVKERAYCAIELASFNRGDSNQAKMLNVGAKDIAAFLAKPHLKFDLIPDIPLGGTYGTVSLAAPTIDTNSLDSPFNTSQVLKSSGAEDVLGVGIDLAALIKDVLLPHPFPPLKKNGNIGPVEWNYVIAALEVGPAVQLQMDFEVDWDLMVTDMKFTDSVTGQPKDVLLFTAIGVDHPINGARVTKLSDVPGFTVGNYQLLNCGPRAMPMVSLVTDPWAGSNETRPPQGGVNVDITYSLVPRLMTVVSLPLVGKVDYEVLSAGAEIKRVGDLKIGPLVEGAHKFKLGEFEVYRSSPQTMQSAGEGQINFTMQAAGPPSFDWNPVDFTGDPSGTYQWTTRSDTQKSYWKELVGMTQSFFPGGGGPSSSTMIQTTPFAKLNADIEINSLKVTSGNGLEIQSGAATPELEISGLIENTGSVSVDGNASLRMNNNDVVLCGNGALRLTNGGSLFGAPGIDDNSDPFSFCNYNTITGAGTVIGDYLKFRNRTKIHNLGQITADGSAGNNGSTGVTLSLTFDAYPEDTSWTITTSTGSTVASGGNYTDAGSTINQTVALAEGTYFFNIDDEFDDGIEAPGGYTITSSSGALLASGGQFTTSETKTFSIISGSHLTTGADSFVNEGILGSNSNGRLIVDSDDLENLIGSSTRADGGQIDLRARNTVHIGSIEAINSGKVLIKPLSSSAYWRAGQSFREDCGGLSARQNGIIEIENTEMNGGCFYASTGGILTTSLSTFNGSVFEIGSPDDASPEMVIEGTKQIFTRSCMNNFGTLRVTGSAEFRDSMLFANHGTIVIPQGGQLTIFENFSTTPGASDEALREPGLANATRSTLLGGKWDIAGRLNIDGADFTTIGADVAPASTTSGSINTEPLDGLPPVSVIVPQESSSHILSGGAPAEITLRGTHLAKFSALKDITTNCGTLRLVEGARFSPSGDFTNNRELYIGPGSSFTPNGIFIQTRPGASTTLAAGGGLNPENQQYDISGGTVTGTTFGIAGSADVRIASPIVDTNEEVYRLERVTINSPSPITSIGASAKVQIHGCAVDFPAFSDNLETNLGHFIISGEGKQNPGKFSAQTGSTEEFINRGQMEITGYTSKFETERFTQLGNASLIRVGAGAQLNVDRILNIDGGEIILEIGSRPFLEDYATITGQPTEVHFADSIVFDFVGELAESIKTVDIGDTWTIVEQYNLLVTGIDQIEFLVNGLAPAADWLPANSHLELSQFETPWGPRGLRLRIKPDAGFRTYDVWAASQGIDPTSYLADVALPFAAPGNHNSNNLTQFIYGSGNPALADLQFVTLETDGNPQDFAKFSFMRPAGTDVTYNPYYSLDLKYWRRAAMDLLPGGLPVAPGELERVTMQTTYPALDGQVFYRIQPEINLENFDHGEVPEDEINWTGGLRDFNQSLIDNGKIVSYLVEPGKSLYFNVQTIVNESGSTIWGGTDEQGNRNFIYRDRTSLKLAVGHSGLVRGGKRALVKVTFIETQQTPFIGSTQDTGNNNQITSKDSPVEAVPYSYRVELIKEY
ncbi:MAG: hypothetical protein ACSHYF_10250 [Verrucomicrobiaceae bacterium]